MILFHPFLFCQRKLTYIEQLRRPQFEAMRACAQGKDVLALMATGSGKTEIAFIAALARRQLAGGGSSKTLMVGPLNNLQQELMDRAKAAGIGVHLISDGADAAEIASIFRDKSKHLRTHHSFKSRASIE